MYSSPFLDSSCLPCSSHDVWDTLHDFDFWVPGSSVCAFLVGSDSHCLEPSWMSLMFDEPILPGVGILSLPSSPPSSSVSTDGPVKDLVRSGVSGGNVWGSFNRGELDALGAPHPFQGVGTLALTGFLKKG